MSQTQCIYLRVVLPNLSYADEWNIERKSEDGKYGIKFDFPDRHQEALSHLRKHPGIYFANALLLTDRQLYILEPILRRLHLLDGVIAFVRSGIYLDDTDRSILQLKKRKFTDDNVAALIFLDINTIKARLIKLRKRFACGNTDDLLCYLVQQGAI